MNVDALLKNALIEGTTKKRQDAVIRSLGWDNFIQLLKEVKYLREQNLILSDKLYFYSPSEDA